MNRFTSRVALSPSRVVAALLLVSYLAVPASAADTLTYETPRKVLFEVTADGLSSIRVGGKVLARGEWRAYNGEDFFKAGPGDVKMDKIRRKTIEVIDEKHARVMHTMEDAVVNYDYSFDGEDVTISARIENNHASSEMAVARFTGLEFTFGRQPEGYMVEQHYTFFQAHGIKLCYPSWHSRIGGSYARDDAIGVGLTPWRVGLTRTLIWWDYTDWTMGKREKLPSRRLEYYVVSPTPSRGARTYDFKMRVSPNNDPKHLLTPYKEYFLATFGPVRYKADYRWVATDYLNHSQAVVGPTNPYGFHPGFRRIDTPEGAAQFCETTLPVLQANNGQGIMVWGQSGDDPRGGMYRPDFDVLPPEVEKQWKTIIAPRFKRAGIKLGVATRPSNMAVKLDWKQDTIININADDAGHREMLWKRFDNMIQKGCTLFYLDSFGASYEDVVLMKWLRGKLGPDILTFAEHECDAILAYSGGYTETTLHAEPKDRTPYYRLWCGNREWEIYHWLLPDCQMAGRFLEVKGKAPPGFESTDRFYLRNRVTPLVPVNDFARAPEIRLLQGVVLDRTGRWKTGDE
jgi:hypothetical protein